MKQFRLFLYSLVAVSLAIWVLTPKASAQLLCNGASCASDGTPVNLATLQAQIDAAPQFISNGGFVTLSTLKTNFPCTAGAMLGKYARVSDVYKTVASVAICETDGVSYYWRPQRTDYATTVTQTSGTLTLIPFVTSPTIVMSSAPTGNLTINPTTDNVWPGAQFRIYMPATISLYGITITGLIGSGTITALQGRDYILTYTASGWKSN